MVEIEEYCETDVVVSASEKMEKTKLELVNFLMEYLEVSAEEIDTDFIDEYLNKKQNL